MVGIGVSETSQEQMVPGVTYEAKAFIRDGKKIEALIPNQDEHKSYFFALFEFVDANRRPLCQGKSLIAGALTINEAYEQYDKVIDEAFERYKKESARIAVAQEGALKQLDVIKKRVERHGRN